MKKEKYQDLFSNDTIDFKLSASIPKHVILDVITKLGSSFPNNVNKDFLRTQNQENDYPKVEKLQLPKTTEEIVTFSKTQARTCLQSNKEEIIKDEFLTNLAEQKLLVVGVDVLQRFADITQNTMEAFADQISDIEYITDGVQKMNEILDEYRNRFGPLTPLN